ncbi:hypothetical protein N8000_07410 [Rhodospirillales bacterium]|nr:hypothetical protein [Rhodospirillales bacterium]
MNKVLLDRQDRDDIRELIRNRLTMHTHLMFTNEIDFLKQMNVLLKRKIAITQKQLDWLVKILEKTHNEKHNKAA